FGPACCLGKLTAICPNDPKPMTMKMDRMTIHAQISEANSNTLVQLHDERISAWPDATVKCEEVEIGHDVRIRRRGARFDEPFLQEYAKVPIDPGLVSILRMNDKKSLHAHRHLNHFVGMRMVHLHAMLLERELISIGFSGRNVLLRQAANAIHSIRQNEPMPMN